MKSDSFKSNIVPATTSTELFDGPQKITCFLSFLSSFFFTNQ